MKGRVAFIIRDKEGHIIDTVVKDNYITDNGLQYIFDRMFPGRERRAELSHIAIGIGAFNPIINDYQTFQTNDPNHPFPNFIDNPANKEHGLPDTDSNWNKLQTEVARSLAVYRKVPDGSTAAIIAAEFSLNSAYYRTFTDFVEGRAQPITEAALLASNFDIDQFRGQPIYQTSIGGSPTQTTILQNVRITEPLPLFKDGPPLDIIKVIISANNGNRIIYQEDIDYLLNRLTGHVSLVASGERGGGTKLASNTPVNIAIEGTKRLNTRHFFDSRNPNHTNLTDLDNDQVIYGYDHSNVNDAAGISPGPSSPPSRTNFIPMTRDAALLSKVEFAREKTVSNIVSIIGKAGFKTITVDQAFSAEFRSFKRPSVFHMTPLYPFGKDTDKENFEIENSKAFSQESVLKIQQAREPGGVVRTSRYRGENVRAIRNTGFNANSNNGIVQMFNDIITSVGNRFRSKDKADWIIPNPEGAGKEGEGRVVSDGEYFVVQSGTNREDERTTLDSIRSERVAHKNSNITVAPRSKLSVHSFSYNVSPVDILDTITFRWRGISLRNGVPIRTRFFVKYFAKKRIKSSVVQEVLDGEFETQEQRNLPNKIWEGAKKFFGKIGNLTSQLWSNPSAEPESYEVDVPKFPHLKISSEQSKYPLPSVPMSPNELPNKENIDIITKTVGWNPEDGALVIEEPGFIFSDENVKLDNGAGVKTAVNFKKLNEVQQTATDFDLTALADNTDFPVIQMATTRNTNITSTIVIAEVGFNFSISISGATTATTTSSTSTTIHQLLVWLKDNLPLNFAVILLNDKFGDFKTSRLKTGSITLNADNSVSQYINLLHTPGQPFLYDFDPTFDPSFIKPPVVKAAQNKKLVENTDYILQQFVQNDTYVVQLQGKSAPVKISLIEDKVVNLGDQIKISANLVTNISSNLFPVKYTNGYTLSTGEFYSSTTDGNDTEAIFLGNNIISTDSTIEKLKAGDHIIVAKTAAHMSDPNNRYIFKIATISNFGSQHQITVESPNSDGIFIVSLFGGGNAVHIKEAITVEYRVESEPIIELYLHKDQFKKTNADIYDITEFDSIHNFAAQDAKTRAWYKLTQRTSDASDDDWDYDVDFNTGEIVFNDVFLIQHATDERIVGYNYISRAEPMWKLIGRTRKPDSPNDLLEVAITLTLPDQTLDDPRTTHVKLSNKDYRLNDSENETRIKAINSYAKPVYAFRQLYDAWHGLSRPPGIPFSISNNQAEINFINAKPSYSKLDYTLQGVNPFEEYVDVNGGVLEIIAISYPDDHDIFGGIEGQSFELFTDMAIVEITPADAQYKFKRFYDYNYQIGDNFIHWIKETTELNRNKSLKSSHQWDKSVKPTVPTGEYGITYIRNNIPDNPNTTKKEEDLMFSRVVLDNPIEVNRDLLLTIVWKIDVK